MFSSCFALSDATFLGCVTSIGQNAFQNCYAISSLTIPSSVTSIQSGVFTWCGFGFIRFLATTPTSVSSNTAWSNILTDCIIFVPFSALAAYLTTANMPAPATYTYIGYATYENGVTLPTQDSTEGYNVTWYATQADALAQTNAIVTGNGSEIYCRYAAV